MAEKRMTLDQLNPNQLIQLCGPEDEFLKYLENYYKVPLIVRGLDVILPDVDDDTFRHLQEVLEALASTIRASGSIDIHDVEVAVEMSHQQHIQSYKEWKVYPIVKTFSGKIIHPKTAGQFHYAKVLNRFDIVFGIGPAGTGKTYLAVGHAVHQLRQGKVERLIITRPAVEAGERLGFLPGDLKEKVDPYLRPIYDALYEFLGKESTEKMIERGVIEIAPLAYMRGRTLDKAYIILDEAQNTTIMQMKMFLTRLGNDAKMVITGDISQVDLPMHQTSGLIYAIGALRKIEDISFFYLTTKDVVRHPLVEKIILAFQEQDD